MRPRGPSKRSRATAAQGVQRCFQLKEANQIRQVVVEEAATARLRCAALSAEGASSKSAARATRQPTRRTSTSSLSAGSLRPVKGRFGALRCLAIIGGTTKILLRGVEFSINKKRVFHLPPVEFHLQYQLRTRENRQAQ